MRDHTLRRRRQPKAPARPKTRSKHGGFVFSTSVRLWRHGGEGGKGGRRVGRERRGGGVGAGGAAATNQQAFTHLIVLRACFTVSRRHNLACAEGPAKKHGMQKVIGELQHGAELSECGRQEEEVRFSDGVYLTGFSCAPLPCVAKG